MSALNAAVRYAVFLVVTAVAVAVSWFLFFVYPDSTLELLGVLLLVLAAPVVLRLAAGIARSVATPYNVAEVGVTGPISRDGGSGPLSAAPMGATAGAVVDQIERADADGSVEALLVRLNTPGGEIVPSEDIRLAVERFDGPTVAYAVDTCASGGYDIASGCDEIWARDGSIVGSIGVIGSRVTLAELADRLGVEYEQLTAGEYKDAGAPWKELEDHEREYLQGLIDDYYDRFVESVAQRREIDEAEIRETEARVYLGSRAEELGLVDETGTRRDVEERLEELLGRPPAVERFEPRLGLTGRFGAGAQRLAYAVGAGIAGTLRDGGRFRFR
jgi:protease-4